MGSTKTCYSHRLRADVVVVRTANTHSAIINVQFECMCVCVFVSRLARECECTSFFVSVRVCARLP